MVLKDVCRPCGDTPVGEDLLTDTRIADCREAGQVDVIRAKVWAACIRVVLVST